MQMSLLSLIPFPIFQIHSSARSDRDALTRLWTGAHKVQVHHVEATMDVDGRRGCALSHKAVAKAQSSVYVVLEDDAIPTRHCFEDVQGFADVFDAVRREAFDIIYLGGLPMIGHTSTPWRSLQGGACWCTHAMIVGARGREWFAKHEFYGTPIDVELASVPIRFGWTRNEWFTQAPSASDVNHTRITKSVVFQSMLATIRPAWRTVVLHRFVSCALVILFCAWCIGSR